MTRSVYKWKRAREADEVENLVLVVDRKGLRRERLDVGSKNVLIHRRIHLADYSHMTRAIRTSHSLQAVMGTYCAAGHIMELLSVIITVVVGIIMGHLLPQHNDWRVQ